MPGPSGMSVALGAALSKKLNGDGQLIYSLHGDGELQEGQIWEAAMFASQKKDNIIVTVDLNGKQIGSTMKFCPWGVYVVSLKLLAGKF